MFERERESAGNGRGSVQSRFLETSYFQLIVLRDI